MKWRLSKERFVVANNDEDTYDSRFPSNAWIDACLIVTPAVQSASQSRSECLTPGHIWLNAWFAIVFLTFLFLKHVPVECSGCHVEHRVLRGKHNAHAARTTINNNLFKFNPTREHIRIVCQSASYSSQMTKPKNTNSDHSFPRAHSRRTVRNNLSWLGCCSFERWWRWWRWWCEVHDGVADFRRKIQQTTSEEIQWELILSLATYIVCRRTFTHHSMFRLFSHSMTGVCEWVCVACAILIFARKLISCLSLEIHLNIKYVRHAHICFRFGRWEKMPSHDTHSTFFAESMMRLKDSFGSRVLVVHLIIITSFELRGAACAQNRDGFANTEQYLQ